jgi:hypothetical protein
MDNYDEEKVFCPICNYENQAGTAFCMNCGEKIEQPVAPWQEVAENPYYPSDEGNANQVTPPVYSLRGYANATEPSAPAPSGGSGLAVASLVCGIVSIVCCCVAPLTSIGGLVTGIITLVQKKKGKGMAVAGVVLSAAAFVIYLILAIIYFVFIFNSVDVDSIYNQYT